MKLGTRIFFCYLIIFAVCFTAPFNWIFDTLRIRYLEGVEDSLADQANILAALAGMEFEDGAFDPEKWYSLFDRIHDRPMSAQIYKLLKDRVDVRIYITDAAGVIRFDSESRETLGEDYAIWRDVRLTLRGEYGARATLADESDPTSTVLFVAAPIRVRGEIAGVLTVAKPTVNIKYFLKKAKPQILGIGLLYLLAATLLSFLVSFLLTRPIQRLIQYARDIRDNRRPPFPKLDRTEIGELGGAFEEMREALEGKRYVEQYVQNLTHEIKSPLSAIRGAAELMAEPMAESRRTRFLANIQEESRRIQQIVDRMLDLAALENRKTLDRVETVRLCPLIRTVLESKGPLVSKKQLTTRTDVPENLRVEGDGFLLHQAVSNLVQNAVDFSPEGGAVKISAKADGDHVRIAVKDQGPGIPEFAREKVFDKFFSLQRPGNGKKSTGLGLNFVQEVAVLHGGRVRLEDRKGGGITAIIEVQAPRSATPQGKGEKPDVR
jgi:two-component system, OmpR family, sensor histidine kinase CreC